MRLLNTKANVFLVAVSALILVTALSQSEASRRDTNGLQQEEGLDAIVRNDFFAGMRGDKARLERGMKFCEDLLSKNPQHAEALVWHGGGLLVRAVHAYTMGDNATGDKLWDTGLAEMNKAAELEPQNMRVKIGRSATLIGYAQSGWDPSDSQSRVLLESALLDYEAVYRWQKPYFKDVPIHSRGELLFGLASGWSLLGNEKKTREYLELIIVQCKNSPYENKARQWLAKKWPLVVKHDCIGCHISRAD